MPEPIPGRHQGKIAIVTGAGRGIGRGVALRLAQEGAHVVVAEYDRAAAEATAAELAALGPEALAYPIDISQIDQIDRMIPAVVAHFGRIDILVNNAGVVLKKPLLDLLPEDYDRTQQINQRGLFFCLQRVARQMIDQIPEAVKAAGRAERSYGKIVNFSSIAGRSGRPTSADYSATKWAVISITQSAAAAFAPYNINVNAVCPGVVRTPMWEYIDETEARRLGLERGEWFERTVATIPLKRAGTPEDVAAAVSFLCSTDADYITGQALNVDGGIEMN
jgi:acetoin reductase-like protein